MTPEQYLATVDLSSTRRELVEMNAAIDPDAAVFGQARAQAQVIGAGVFAFAPEVPVAMREAVSDSLLLAQLVANKQALIDTQPMPWFAAYTQVLANLGWTLTASGWTDYKSDGTAADVHQEILGVLTAVLGPAPAALAIVTASVNALKAMDAKSSWIRIFSKESQHASLARFQLGAVEHDAGTISITMLACLMEATSINTHVLLFKTRHAVAAFQASHPRLATTEASLTRLHPAILAKVQAYQATYLSSIADLKL